MPKKISAEEAHSLGVDTRHDLMDNGERRFRLVCSDGSSYCRTVASDKGAWQNSHYHTSLTEYYVVQTGWIIYAEYKSDGAFKLHYFGQGGSVIVNPLIHHNIYMSSNTVIHTIKYGGGVENDWFPSPELDKLTKQISEDELLLNRLKSS